MPKSTVGWRIEEEEEERGEAVRAHISRFLLAGRKRHIYAPAGREPVQLFENRHYALKPAGEHCSRKCVRNPRTEVMSLLGLIVEKPPKTADFPGFFWVYYVFLLTSEAGGEEHEEAEERRVEPEVERHFLASRCFFFCAKMEIPPTALRAGKEEGDAVCL